MTRFITTQIALSLLLGALVLGGCGGIEDDPTDPPNPSPDDTMLKSSKSRITSPSVSSTVMGKLVDGNTAFALSLYDRLRGKSNDSFFFSPHSISEALAMTYAGAKGTTESQMASALHFALSQPDLHSAMNALDLALASRGKGAKGKDGKGFRLNVSNALWVQRNYNVLASYLDVLAQNYGAGMRPLNFLDQPDASRKTINAWVAEQTEQKIKELLDPGSVQSNTRLVLTNTIYFNAAWAEVFPTEYSSTGSFTSLDGTKASVPMMSNTKQFRYGTGAGWQAVELPYDGKEISMVVIVPDAGQFPTVEKSVVAKGIESMVGALQPAYLHLTLPKWRIRSKFSGKEELKALGMVEPFDGSRANFQGINGGIEPLWISDVIHEAFLAVDEYGTEAAAATAVIMAGGGLPPKLTVDRPFIFAIRDVATRSILFMGRMTKPQS